MEIQRAILDILKVEPGQDAFKDWSVQDDVNRLAAGSQVISNPKFYKLFNENRERLVEQAAGAVARIQDKLNEDLRGIILRSLGTKDVDPRIVHFAVDEWSHPAWQEIGSIRVTGSCPLIRVGTTERHVAGRVASFSMSHVAVVPLIGAGNVVFTCRNVNRAKANQAFQNLLLRALATTAPGKIRMTLVDAAGYGQNVDNLMKLPEVLRGAMAWHDTSDIEREVILLTQKLAEIIQQKLTNEHADIVAFNDQAGEVVEPFRILAIANLPVNITPNLWQHIVSLAENGPRAGIHVVATLVEDERMPHNCDPQDLLRLATTLSEHDGVWWSNWLPLAWNGTLSVRDNEGFFGVVTLDPVVPSDIATSIVATVSQQGQFADEVKIDSCKVLSGEIWSGVLPTTEREGISVPIGLYRARERLCLEVQMGTTHHALIGGQTGSGKSVLLHDIILGLAHGYSPELVELQLVDFKEGVEFRPYANLPHVRVVAMQAEREFGLSVLEGINREMVRRGEAFRAHGVESIKAWHKSKLGPMPIVFLIIDEFQVLFAWQDKISAQSRKFLDHIVRDGRGFGVHVILATQSLASVDIEVSTLSQIGIRIAMRMGEHDSYRILSKDNDEATHLTRPGEAIYNSAGGQRGHNVRFQAALLTREQIEAAIPPLAELAVSRGIPSRTIVFDGSHPALFNSARIQQSLTQAKPNSLQKWLPCLLGEPLSVEPGHTTTKLRRQSRSNLLIVGNDEKKARAEFAACLVTTCLAAQDETLVVNVLDLTDVDSEQFGGLDDLQLLPQEVTVHHFNQRRVIPTLAAFEAEVRRRIADIDNTVLRPAWILAVFGFQRMRETFREGAMPPPATKSLSLILRDGPEVGIHIVAWVDSHSSFLRSLENKELEEFEVRVALGGGDCGRVLGDHAQANSALKQHYALKFDRNLPDEISKFKCYDLESVLAAARAGRNQVDVDRS